MISDLRFKKREQAHLSGFTLTEILVVISLAALISTFALGMSLDAFRSYNFRSEQTLLLSLLQKARSQAMSNIDQLPHGVHVSGNQYTLYEGSAWKSRDVLKDADFPVGKGVAPSGVTDMLFTQLSGKPVSAGDIVLSDGGHASVIFSINSQGRINY